MLKVVTMKRRTKVVTEVVVDGGYKLHTTLVVGGREMRMVSEDTWVNVMGADRAALRWLELME